jgi:hypothetical protein
MNIWITFLSTCENVWECDGLEDTKRRMNIYDDTYENNNNTIYTTFMKYFNCQNATLL